MINYVELVGKYYPDVQVSCIGDPSVYTNLSWVSTVISQLELDAVHLVEYKTDKIMLFSEYARDEIIAGFTSSAQGFPHHYDAEPEDQLNLIGSVATGVDMPYACRVSTQGYQIVDFNGAVVAGNATGLANNTTTYNCEIQVDGVSTYLSIQGSNAQTFTALINQINADVDFSALGVASIEGGNIKITSLSYGSDSSINIIIGSLFTTLTGYVGLQTAVDGIDPANGAKEYKWHTHTQLLQVINDGKDIKLSVLQKFNVKKEQLLAAASIATVDAINWD